LSTEVPLILSTACAKAAAFGDLRASRAASRRPTEVHCLASGLTRFTSAFGVLAVVPKIFAIKRYREERLEAARETGGEGRVAELVRVEEEGRRISRDEMVAMLFLLLFAGHETTAHLVSGSVHELLRNSGLRDWMEEDWSRANLAVEKFLQFVSPMQFSKPRFARKDVELGGIRLKKGNKIMPMLQPGTSIRKRVYNCQQLHLRHSLARSTISESQDTKCDVDQSARNRENWRCPLCEGNHAIAPVSSEFGGIIWWVGLDRKPAETFG
jgi:hypothetical protein